MNSLSSNKNRILLLSDPHQDVLKFENILKNENYDHVVCLGDWLDSLFHNSPSETERAIVALRDYSYSDNFHICWGNHDIQYFWNNDTTLCRGFEPGKRGLVRKILGEDFTRVKSKFKWYIWVDDFFCSHSGLNEYSFSPLVNLRKESINKWLDEQIGYAERALEMGERHWLYGAGKARGGLQSIGGLIWQDWRYEFHPIDGLNQIVGHTSSNMIRTHGEEGYCSIELCNNFNIDCHLNEYLIIENGNVSVSKYTDL